jgi:hypothetical protein
LTCRDGLEEIARLLLVVRADGFEAKDESGFIVLDCAGRWTHREVEQLVRDAVAGESDQVVLDWRIWPSEFTSRARSSPMHNPRTTGGFTGISLTGRRFSKSNVVSSE